MSLAVVVEVLVLMAVVAQPEAVELVELVMAVTQQVH
jgi:hypothetical protein